MGWTHCIWLKRTRRQAKIVESDDHWRYSQTLDGRLHVVSQDSISGNDGRLDDFEVMLKFKARS